MKGALPTLTDAERTALLTPPTGAVRMVLDTDTDNEIDDQFALSYCLLSPERLSVEAVYAAPFHNSRSSGPEDGMRRSHAEIVRVLSLLGRAAEGFAHLGSTAWLSERAEPERSAAACDLAERALAGSQEPLYVVAIGAPTNVASALLLAPEIVRRIVVVWLGGNACYWPHAAEFNLSQDLAASRALLDSGVPLIHLPCYPVASHLATTQAELERYVKGRGRIGDYLYQIYSACYEDHRGRSRVIWDLAPIAWLVNPDWVPTSLAPSPVLTDEETWREDSGRHFIREARFVDRDAVFGDLFAKLERRC